jgi:putative alpha-1,2-mannosidase
VSKAVISVSGNKTFTIEAKGLSAANKYVQSISLNGKPYTKNYISHKDIMNGGKMVFIMSSRVPAPNTRGNFSRRRN